MKTKNHLFYILPILFSIFISCNKIKEVAPSSVKNVLKNNFHKLDFEYKGDSLYFVFSRISKSDYFSVYFDMNNNKMIDTDIDIGFATSGDYLKATTKLCPLKIKSINSTSTCGALLSKARAIYADQTVTYVIPRSEISKADLAVTINFTVKVYNSESKAKSGYPKNLDNYDFSEVFTQKF
jgi:hypothetical protein